MRLATCTGNAVTNGMSRRHFDPDTRDIVQIRVVHGSWKRDDPNGKHIDVSPFSSFFKPLFHDK